MKCKEDIKALADSRLVDAECLMQNKRYDSAFYLAGYVVELLLKAKVCKNLGIEDFFDFGPSNQRKLKNEAYKPLKYMIMNNLLCCRVYIRSLKLG